MLRGKFLTGRRPAGLAYDRASLRTGGKVERAANLEILPFVVDRVHLGAVRENARFRIGDDGLWLPGCPQLIDDLDPFAGHFVALVVLVNLVEAEILRGAIIVGGDEIDANPAAAKVIERRRKASAEIRRIKRGRHGRDNSQTSRGLSQDRDKRHGVRLGREKRMAQVGIHAALIGIGYQ